MYVCVFLFAGAFSLFGGDFKTLEATNLGGSLFQLPFGSQLEDLCSKEAKSHLDPQLEADLAIRTWNLIGTSTTRAKSACGARPLHVQGLA